MTDTKLSARIWLEHQSKIAAAGIWEPPSKVAETRVNGDPTFEAYSKQWLTLRSLAPSTRADYERMLEHYLLPVFGSKRLGNVSVAEVREWHEGFKPDKPTARARTYGLLRTIFNSAWRDDLIQSNPCRVWGASNVKRRSRTDLPTPLQVVQLADAMPSAKYRVMTLLAATCGLRFGELTELRRKDVEIEDGQPVRIRIRRAVTRVRGEFVVGSPKSEAGVRDVVIPDGVQRELSAYLRGGDKSKDALLFPGSRSGGHMQPSTLYRVFYPAREQVGLPTLRWHDLRHFAGTTATQSGATLADVQRYLGHSTVSAAMKYQHAAAASSERIAGKMAQVIPLKPAVND